MEIKTICLTLFMLVISSCQSDVDYLFTEGVRTHLKQSTIDDLNKLLARNDSIYGESMHGVIAVCDECEGSKSNGVGNTVLGMTINDTIKLNLGGTLGLEKVKPLLEATVLHERHHLVEGSKKLNEAIILGGNKFTYCSGFILKQSPDETSGYTSIEEGAVEFLTWHDGLNINDVDRVRMHNGYYGMAMLFQVLEDRGEISKEELYEARKNHDIEYVIEAFFDKGVIGTEEGVKGMNRAFNLSTYVVNLIRNKDTDIGNFIEGNGQLEKEIQDKFLKKAQQNGGFPHESEFFLLYNETIIKYICNIVIKRLRGAELPEEDLQMLLELEFHDLRERFGEDDMILPDLMFER